MALTAIIALNKDAAILAEIRLRPRAALCRSVGAHHRGTPENRALYLAFQWNLEHSVHAPVVYDTKEEAEQAKNEELE